ncbi:MAG: energy transducer TonB [Pseudomonadota bacterium]
MRALSLFAIAVLAPAAQADPSLTLRDPHGGSAVLWQYPLPDLGQAQGVEPSCPLTFEVRPGGLHRLLRAGCGEPLASALTAAAARWTFVAVAPGAGHDAVEVEVMVRASPLEPGGWRLGLSSEGDAVADVPTVAIQNVKVLHRVAPKMPEAAKEQGISEARCTLRFFVDAAGVPYDIRAEDCPEMFVAGAMEAGWQWRFEPLEVDGVPTRAQFVLKIIYRVR